MPLKSTKLKIRLTKLTGKKQEVDYYPDGWWIEGYGGLPMKTYNVYLNPVIRSKDSSRDASLTPRYYISNNIRAIFRFHWGSILIFRYEAWKWEVIR
jgi:hypothetical protein